ncbi:MAG TPA: ThiF family adenylyltransferase [Gemmatimonadaceae bacterium]|nr:ThiF family adenylyltransferase [Gemmatimonadaceae bacterium]
MSERVPFSYDEMVTRNAGFLTPAEQRALRDGRVFVCGVGGMGGAALQSLVRAGVGHFTLADMDAFETSNLNRQVFATLDSLGQPKVAATCAALARINPEVGLTTFGPEWVEKLDAILPVHPVVINGMDDLAAGIALYRKAREHGATVIDAYTAPLPSITVVRPADPRPEERLRYPTLSSDWRALTPAQLDACRTAEAIYVMVHSSSANHIDVVIAAELMAGRRSRPSFAPMVIETGTLMAFEAVKLLLGRDSGVDHRGLFLNPWTMTVERPKPAPVAWVRERLARRFLARMLA